MRVQSCCFRCSTRLLGSRLTSPKMSECTDVPWFTQCFMISSLSTDRFISIIIKSSSHASRTRTHLQSRYTAIPLESVKKSPTRLFSRCRTNSKTGSRLPWLQKNTLTLGEIFSRRRYVISGRGFHGRLASFRLSEVG